MNVLRWLISVPVASATALVVDFWADRLSTALLLRGPVDSVMGALPLLIVSTISTITFIVAGSLISPGKGKKTVLLFVALAFLGSPARAEAFAFHNAGWSVMFAACLTGIFAGAGIGLLAGFKIQKLKNKAPNQMPEPTPDVGAHR